ncbi:LysR family transcriptional regulator substrate-binding protein [Paenibacillus peoriae]|uniref:LysR family transcriptional regulator substrate-binding protein n=1 Tax=Paenibacillus peoriae TaxID=59893 RepID=UPI0021166445|nr:LysR family transcriptional regulator substrate-binding protein [Paenibacillus peoriae]
MQASGLQLSLAISAAESISHFVLPPVYRMLNQHTPSIRLQIRTQHTQEAFDSIERREMDVAFVVREIVSPSVTVKPFFTGEMMLLRLAVSGRQAGDTVEMEELAAQDEVFINWNRKFQFRHDQWWDPLCPSRVHLDTAGLITTFLKDARQWTIVPASIGAHMMRMGDFVLVALQGTFCRSCRLPRGVIAFEQPLQCQNLRRYARALILRHPRRFQNRWTQTVEKPLGNVHLFFRYPRLRGLPPVFVLIILYLILYLRQMFIQRSRTQKTHHTAIQR